MAQTTNFFGLVSGSPKLYYNATGGSAYTDVSGEIVAVTLPDNERGAGGVHTLDGDLAIVAAGKIAPGQMTLRAIFAPASSGFWADVQSSYQNGTPLYFRFYPAGSAAGRPLYVSGAGTAASTAGGSANNGGTFVQKRPVPVTDAESADVMVYEVPVMCPGFTGFIL